MKRVDYTYVVIRYTHDPLVGESLNVGVLLCSPEAHYVGCRTDSRVDRLASAFSLFDVALHRRTLRKLEEAVAEMPGKLPKRDIDLFGRPSDASEVLAAVWPDLGTQYTYGTPMVGTTDDLRAALESHFERLVSQGSPGEKEPELLEQRRNRRGSESQERQIAESAVKLAAWSDRLDARAKMPSLVRKLVLSGSAEIVSLSFRADEGTQLAGWDGLVLAGKGDAFVPQGQSVWEIGTDQNVPRKANVDFSKRTADTLGMEASTTTFVFVTSRRWAGKEKWAREKRLAGPWADVRAYDADDLATWLDTAPAAKLWLDWLIGSLSPGAASLEGWWTDWSFETKPAYTPELVIGGREKQEKEVLTWLEGPPKPLQLRADSQEEAMAFFAACVLNSPPSLRDRTLARSVVLEDGPQWQMMSQGTIPLVLVPTFAQIRVSAAARRGHHVLVPLGNDSTEPGSGVQLPRARRRELERVFLGMGLSRVKAVEYATLGRRSFGALRRSLASAEALLIPAWARPGVGRGLLTALLVGSWDDNNASDRELVQEVSGMPYEEVAKELIRLANESDPPVRQVANVWYFLARREGWFLLARNLSASDMERLRNLVLAAFRQVDTAYELSKESRYLAGISGKGHPHSSLLREGLSRGLALMAAYSEFGPSQPGSSGQEVASYVVRELFKDADWVRWASLSSYLPQFAEAAPSAFLDAVAAGLGAADSPVLRLFSEEDGQGFGHSPHTGLLWALECLCWSPGTLTRSALLLAELARMDPGGRLANRPLASLREVFVLWVNNTSSTYDQRFATLDRMAVAAPAVTWTLLLALLPQPSGLSSPTYKPLFRDWPDHVDESVLISELIAATSGVVRRAVAFARADSKLWLDLLPKIGNLPPHDFAEVVGALREIEPSSLSPELRKGIWNELREIIARHSLFSEAEWALPAQLLAELESEYARLSPVRQIDEHSWLFSDRARLAGFDFEDYEGHGEALLKERSRAALAVYGEEGLEGLYDLASASERPEFVGDALGRVWDPSREDEGLLIGQLENTSDGTLRALASGYLRSRAFRMGSGWVDRELGEGGLASSSPVVRLNFYFLLPAAPATWARLGLEPEDLQKEYWRGGPLRPAETVTDEDYLYLVDKLATHGRALEALEFTQWEARRGAPRLSATNVIRLLEGALHGGTVSPERWHGFAYTLGMILDMLADAPEVPAERVAALEFQFIKLLDHTRQPKLLHKMLASDPSFFVECLKIVFKPRNAEHPEISEEGRQKAALVYDLLRSWRTLPGLKESGDVDGEALNKWVDEVRRLASECDRIELADQHIGGVLFRTPYDSQEGWPHPAACAVVERIVSTDIETGMSIGIRNSRGVTMRDPESGGELERLEAAKFQSFADRIRDRFPKTAAVLDGVAESYIADGRREDARGELEEDGR